MSKQPTKVDLAKWLAEPPKKTGNRCTTCSSGTEICEAIVAYVSAYNAGKTKKRPNEMLELLRVAYGYEVAESSYRRHLKVCLKFKPNG